MTSGAMPTTGATTTPNGRTYNTNPAANAYMAQMAAQAKSQQPAGQMSQYNQLMQTRPDLQGQIDPRAAAANPAGLQQQIDATNSYNKMMETPEGKQMLSNLPAGVDKYAVAANPAAFQQWQQQAKAQEAANPGSTMLSQQQQTQNAQWDQQRANQQQAQYGQPAGRMAADAQRQMALIAPTGQMGKGGQPPSPQALSQGLQQQQTMQQRMGQIPMSNQRQPQGGMAGRNMPPQQPMQRPMGRPYR